VYLKHAEHVWAAQEEIDRLLPDGTPLIFLRNHICRPGWLVEIEGLVYQHPSVAEVCVAGIPDARQVEAVKAWVVLETGKTATAEEIQAWCKEKLAHYKIPRFVGFRPELPKTMVGKVLRRVLQEQEKSEEKK